jgi:hypothetical protein
MRALPHTVPLAALMLAAILFAAPAGASATISGDACDVDSDWDVRLGEATLAFEREAPSPRRVEIGAGEIRVDGRALALDARDREQLRRFEAEVRALVPEAKALAADAVDIAFRALERVGVALAGSDEASRVDLAEKLATSRMLLNRRVDDAFAGRETLGEAEMDALIAEAVEAMVPVITGHIVAHAVRVAMSGDEAAAKEFEARAERLGAEIEREIEGKAAELEARGEALCRRIVALDEIERGFSPTLLDGAPLNLIDVRRGSP